MAKKSKSRQKPPASSAQTGPKISKSAAKKPEKRPAGKLTLNLPLSRARKLAADLYQAAGLKLWAEALDAAEPDRRDELIQLQDAICDAGDLLKMAKASNPKRLALFMVACYDREGLPATLPQFITAASESEALAIWKAAFKGEYGRRQPRAARVPERGDKPELHA